MRFHAAVSAALLNMIVVCSALPALDAVERERVHALIATVRSATGCVFIRNGREHSVNDAAKLMEYKLDSANDLASAEAFIDRELSRSSTTGNEYQIRTATGATLPSNGVLKAWLTPRSATAAPTRP